MSRPPDDVVMVRFVPDGDVDDSDNAVAATTSPLGAFPVAAPDAPRPPRGSAASVRARREPVNSKRDSRAKPRARGVTFLELPDVIAVDGAADGDSAASSPADAMLPRLQRRSSGAATASSPSIPLRRDTDPGHKSLDMAPAATVSRRSTFRKTVVAPSRPLADLTDAPSFPPRALGSFVGSKEGREKRLTDARRRATLQRKREQLQRGNAPELRAEPSAPSLAPDIAPRGSGSVAFGRGHGGGPRQRQRHVTVAVGARRGRERARTLHKLHKGGNAASSGTPSRSYAAATSAMSCDPDSEDSNDSSDGVDSGDSDFVLDVRRERLRCERREARRRARREAREEQLARLAYLDKPGRRHTSARAKTFIADRPELLSMLKAYYMPRYPQAGSSGSGNSDEGASQANPQRHFDDTKGSAEAGGEHQQQVEQARGRDDVPRDPDLPSASVSAPVPVVDTRQRAGQRRGSLGASARIVTEINGGTATADSAGSSTVENTSAVSVTDTRIAANPDHEAQYANNEHYSDQALLQREALKFDPQVLRVLDEIWRVTDADGNGRIDKDEYVLMSTKLYRVVVGIDTGIGSGSDSNSIRDERQVRHARRALRFANEEWENDRLGLDYLDRPRFTQAWFQLTDLWTENICAEEYARFLGDVLECLTVRIEDECGRLTEDREWRTDAEICTLAEWQAGGGRLAPRRRHGRTDGEISLSPPRQARGTVVAVSPKKAPTRGRAPSFMARRNDAGFFKIRRSTIAAMRRLSQAVGGSAHAMQQALKRVIAMDTLGEMSEGSEEEDGGDEGEREAKGENVNGRTGNPSSAVDEAVRALGSKTRREIAALVAFHGRNVQKPIGRVAAGTASAPGYVHSKSSAERPPAYAGVYSETGRHHAAVADMLDGQAMLSHTSVKYAGTEGVQLYSSMPLRAMHYGGGYHYDPSGGQRRAGSRGVPPPLELDDWTDGTLAAGQRGRADGAAAAQALIAEAQQRDGVSATSTAERSDDAAIDSLLSALMVGAKSSQGGNAMFVSDSMEEALLTTLKVRYRDGESEESKNAQLGQQRRRQVEEAMQRLASEYEPHKSNYVGHGHIDRRKLLGDALGATAPGCTIDGANMTTGVGNRHGDALQPKSKASQLHWIHMEGEHYVPGVAAASGTGAGTDGNGGAGTDGSWLASPADKARLGSQLCQAKMRERRKRRQRRQRRAKLGSVQLQSSISGLGRGAIQQLLEHGDSGSAEGVPGKETVGEHSQDKIGTNRHEETGEDAGGCEGDCNVGSSSHAANFFTFDRGAAAVAPSMGSRNFCGKAIQVLATNVSTGVVNDAELGATHAARGPESESNEVLPWTRLMSLQDNVSKIRYPLGGELKSRFSATFEEPVADASMKREADGDRSGKHAQEVSARLLRPLSEVKAQDANTDAVDMARAKRYDFATHTSVRYQTNMNAKKRATIHAGRGKEKSTGGFVVMW